MRTLTAVVLIFMASFVVCQPPEDLPYQAWKSRYGVQYSGPVDAFRQMVFNENMAFIRANNQNPNRQVTLGPNQFSALTFQEFSAAFLTFKQVITTNYQGSENQFSAPGGNGGGSGGSGGGSLTADLRSIDWRAQGKVTSVKNQGSCGSCVPFSVAASIESSFLIKNGLTLDLSEQQLVDCVVGNSGCNGGRYEYAFRYVATNQMGITAEILYPYQARNLGSCSVNGGDFKIGSYVISTKGNCQALRDLVFSNGPASVAVAADRNFQSYKSGVLSKCGTQLNHAVLLTGFDTEKWHIKNSWGTGWGQLGYIYLKAGASTCGVCNDGGHRATAL